jgi:hypothetical protein
MARFGNRGMRWRTVSPRLGFLLILTILGHDLLMAAPVRAASHDDGRAVHHPAEPLESLGIDTTPGDGAPQPKHPDGCGIVQAATSPTANDLDWLDQDLASHTVANCHEGMCPVVRLNEWQVLRWPPGTRRALLQVYRL